MIYRIYADVDFVESVFKIPSKALINTEKSPNLSSDPGQTSINPENSAKGSFQIMKLRESEAPSVPGRGILLVGAEHTVQGLISTFLLTMGWTCTVVQNKEELPAILKRKAFDAVVIDLGRSMAEAQKAIRRIAHIRPSLVGRILALNSQGTGRGMLEFIERNDLIQLSHSSRRFVQNEHFARIVFALIRTLIASHPLLPRREQTPKKQSRRARLCA